jgi:hypothetical protein
MSIKKSWDEIVQTIAKDDSDASIGDDGPLQKVCLNQQGLGLKKSQNNGAFKIICMKVI